MTLPLPATDGCSGNQTYTVLPDCVCSHGAYFHDVAKGKRKACSAWFGSKCSCVVYQARSDTDA